MIGDSSSDDDTLKSEYSCAVDYGGRLFIGTCGSSAAGAGKRKQSPEVAWVPVAEFLPRGSVHAAGLASRAGTTGVYRPRSKETLTALYYPLCVTVTRLDEPIKRRPGVVRDDGR